MAKFKVVKERPRFSEAEFAKALKRHDGNQTKVAKKLGLSAPSIVSVRIKRAKSGSPLAQFKGRGRGRGGGRPKKFSDAQIAKALERNNGNQTKAAKDLKKISGPAVNYRIKHATSDSPLAKFKKR